jgi:hypothetical protein
MTMEASDVVDDLGELDRFRALLDEKIRIAQGMGVDARDRQLSANVLYEAVFNPTFFTDPENAAQFADERYPDRVERLKDPITGVEAPAGERGAVVRDLYDAMISNETYGQAVYPDAIDTVAALMRHGKTIIWTEGSRREQVQKVIYAGLGANREQVAGETGRHRHDVLQVDASQSKFTAETVQRLASEANGRPIYVFDDRLENLIRMKAALGRDVSVVAVWVQQGRYGQRIPKDLPQELRDVTPEQLMTMYHAQPSLAAAVEAFQLLSTNTESLFVVDFDGVIGDNDLRVALQSNAVRERLVALGVPLAIAQVRDPADIVREYREQEA